LLTGDAFGFNGPFNIPHLMELGADAEVPRILKNLLTYGAGTGAAIARYVGKATLVSPL